MANPFVHVELHTQDPEKAKEFYRSLFDWQLEGDRDYTIIKVGERGIGGGIMMSPVPNASPQWIPYVAVDNIDDSIAKAQALGAKLLQGPTEISGIGWVCMLLDPTGAAFALIQPVMPR